MSSAAKTLVFVTTLLVIYKPTAAQFGCFSGPGCNAGDAVTASSAQDCCVNTDDGLFYSDGGACMQCNTFGWTVRTLERPESALSYSVNAGYFKGTGNTVAANIQFVSDSSAPLLASAADFESALFINRVVMRAGNPSSVSITLSVDNVAQEGTERGILRLVLTPGATPSPGIFFRSDLRVVIEDTSTAMIGFNAIEYANNEEQLSVDVTVRKISAIANPVSVRIQPLTVQQALDMNLAIPAIDVNITAIDEDVPIRAKAEPLSVRDFSDSFIDLTFEADELATDRTEQITVNIPLVDDDIDEADREYFVLYLTLLSATSPDDLLDNVVSVGGIDDNDDTVIGFEMMAYSFDEPAISEVEAGENIFLAKQGVTELTYIVLLQLSLIVGGATPDEDYSLNINQRFGLQVPFPPDVQRLQLFSGGEITFTILPDGLAEGPEAFILSSAPDATPTYLRPTEGDSVFPTATITILDDDNITVGWEQTTYTVSESAGVVEACYRIFSPPPSQSLRDLIFFMSVDTQPGTADESDYVPLRSIDFDMERELNNGIRRACIEVIINSTDNIYENSEEFCIDLLFSNPQDRFFVEPNVTCVTVEDNTEVTVGFIGAPYQAAEDMGPMVFTVGVIGDTVLERDVVVSFSTVDGSTPGVMAVAGSDYVMRSGVLLTFNATTRTIQVPVDLIDDLMFENDEDFNGVLTLVSGERVTVAPDNALATIVENEVVCEELELLVDGRIEYFPDTTAPYLVDTEATHICNPGFILIGNVIRVCQNDTDFDGTPPTCQPIECLPLPSIANGDITYSPDNNMANYSLGTVATYACNAGFVLDFSNGGSEMRTCVDDGDGDAEGVFDRQAPACIPIECEPLRNITNGRISYADDMIPNYELGTVATYECDDGFFLDGDDQRNCTAGDGSSAIGVFSGQEPSCVPIECLPLPSIDNGVITYAPDNVPDYALGTVATYSCNEGFTLNLEVGSETRECVDDGDGDALGVFNRQAPSCESRGNRVNDTVTGDPLFTVPLNVLNKSAIMNVGEDDPINLCFEVHGESGAFFNLVSDTCVSVNARYSQVRAGENINIVDRIYVRASGLSGVCRNIEVSLDQCRASVDGVSVENYMMDGITVRRFRNRVRIVVPNCQDIDLVMWVFCLNTTFWSRASTDENEITFNAEMIRFVIARGLDLDERSHGLIGQFWNIPIQVAPYTGPVREGLSSDGYYVITTNHPNEGMRQFIGWLYPLTWEHRSEYCLYGGQYQGGPLYEILDDSVNNGVIFGDYTDYRVASQYATDFAYSHFDESQCSEPAVTPA